MKQKSYKKAVFLVILSLLVALVALLIQPFIKAVLAAMILAYVFYPVYRGINKKLQRPNLASFITTFILIIALSIPVVFISNTISQDTLASYLLYRQRISNLDFLNTNCDPSSSSVCVLSQSLYDRLSTPQVKYYLDTSIESVSNKITTASSDLLFQLPQFLFHLFITLFITFFLFRDGPRLVDKIKRLLPVKTKFQDFVVRKLSDMSYAVMYGNIVVALIQGILGGIGFFIFGLPSPILWGLVMMLMAFIPYFGTAIVWFPASVILVIQGFSDSDSTLILKGFLFFAYGALLVSTIDNILKPKIIGDRGGLHPALVLLGVVGGLTFMGAIGIFVGPLIIAMLVAFVKIYEEET